LVNLDLGALCSSVAFDLRRSIPVDSGLVLDTARELIRREAQARRQALLLSFLKRPSNPDGIRQARRWLLAVTGDERAVDLAALLHFLWLVKCKQSGRPSERHCMLILCGAAQGTGKSTALRKLIAPWGELADFGMDAATLCDERSTPTLAFKAIGMLDELAGLPRADATRLKQIISASEVGYRPMRSNDRRTLPMMMTLCGTSNRSVAELVYDPTGARRFYELRVPARCDWRAINEIDYSLLWQAVSEDEAPPGVLHADAIAAEQRKLVWIDVVEQWLAEEDFGKLDVPDGGVLPQADPVAGILTRELYARLRAWCRAHGEREPSAETMGRRLTALGWQQFRTRASGRKPGYRRIDGSDPGHPDHGSTSPGEDTSDQRVQGGMPLSGVE
jgi:hypothetical protein